ncbi:hypothetical protein BD413DRAFT_232604 [Trametes elegans]|nr:hypothetical protein BD413DRAFT_232604 [Trametes elegans]
MIAITSHSSQDAQRVYASTPPGAGQDGGARPGRAGGTPAFVILKAFGLWSGFLRRREQGRVLGTAVESFIHTRVRCRRDDLSIRPAPAQRHSRPQDGFSNGQPRTGPAREAEAGRGGSCRIFRDPVSAAGAHSAACPMEITTLHRTECGVRARSGALNGGHGGRPCVRTARAAPSPRSPLPAGVRFVVVRRRPWRSLLAA